ncbi:ABC transporter permease [Melioribacteraceae bacterium 4301-Me]|uniref:ABC transporter permease n=1 Tax=Pyranulibacter aquaticus TaxID=3163344 RepID=UPI003598A998
MFEFFIAKRYIKAKHKISFISIISAFSTLGITIGVAALVIVLSVFNGFGSIVTSILISFDPHVRINILTDSLTTNYNSIYKKIQEEKYVELVSPFVEGKVIAMYKKSYEILNMKGITSNNSNLGHNKDWGVATKIISGKYDLISDSKTNKIILGLPTALRLSVRVGDTISVTSAYNIERAVTNFAIPNTKKFLVTGIFESNNREYDVSYIFTSIDSGQKLFGLGKSINGFDLRLTDIDKSNSVKKALLKKLGTENYSVNTWYDLHKDLYNVMIIERWSAYILLCLIIAVATFNILGSLTMSVLEKKKDIGLIRSLGAKKTSIQKIFLSEGFLLGLLGTTAGIFIGLLICYLQIKYNLYPLDPTKYIIDSLPIQVRISDIIAVGGMSFLLTFFAALYPAKRAANTVIIESIKYE